MKKTIFIIFLILASLITTFAQSGTPKFENYAISTVYKGKNATLKLDKDTNMFRTRIRDASGQKPNFAGEYVFTLWGCGTSCINGAVINVRTGKAYLLPFTVCCWSNEAETEPVQLRLKSRLMVFHGLRNESEKDDPNDVHYYEFINGKFRFIKTLKRKETK